MSENLSKMIRAAIETADKHVPDKDSPEWDVAYWSALATECCHHDDAYLRYHCETRCADAMGRVIRGEKRDVGE